MQFHHETSAAFETDGRQDVTGFATYLGDILAAQDDVTAFDENGSSIELRHHGWQLMSDVADYHSACAQVLTGLIEGLAAAYGRSIRVEGFVTDSAESSFVWRITER